MALKEILEAREVAEYLHLHIFTVHKLAREGVLPAFKIGHGWRFRKASLDEWIQVKEDSIKRKKTKRTRTPLKKGVFY
ncbi:MAG: helix-turn-helix domain-containing protein [Candidatus Omnitrophota bacterium]